MTSMIKHKQLIALIAVGFLQAACTPMTRETIKPGDPGYAPISAEMIRVPAPVNGSLHAIAPNYSLFGDRVAHGVGDVLTITLEERTQASKKTDSSSSKKSEISFDEGSILGTGISAGNLSMLTNASQERTAEGDADAGQSNSLSGNISVTVAEVMPNGLLRIRGEKWLTLAEGDEFIRLSGLVRPEDISIDNTIISTKIADARIAYSATGAFASVNRQGWLTEFFNSEWWPL
jgi:flagellar L-ring protein precursor FlgH